MTRFPALLAAIASLIAAPSIASAASGGKDRYVTIRNDSSEPVHRLYATPVGVSTWEEDLLGDGTVPAGRSKRVQVDAGTNECRYRLKIVMAGGREHQQRDANLCAVRKWTISDSADLLE